MIHDYETTCLLSCIFTFTFLQPPPSTAGLAGKVPAELLTIPTQRPRIGPPRPDIELMSAASPSIIPTDHTEALNMRTGPMSNPGELVPEICPLFAGTTNPGVTSQTADTPTMVTKQHELGLISYNCKGFKQSFTYCTDLLQQCDILYLSETWLRPCELSSIEKCVQGGVNGNSDVFAKSGMADIDQPTGPMICQCLSTHPCVGVEVFV